MLKAGALYYAVFLSFLIALTAGFFILYTYFYNFFIDQQLLRDQVIADVYSAIDVFCEDPDAFNYDATTLWTLSENENNHDVEVIRKHWGAYDLLFVKSAVKHYDYQKIAISGDYLDQKDKYALYLADKKKYLSLSGSTQLNGDCYLPELGIKRAYIEGQGYRNDKLVYGEIRESQADLPQRNLLIDAWAEPYLSSNYPKTDSTLFLSEMERSKAIYNSFNNKTLLLLTDFQTGFPRIPVSGNVIIHSEEQIVIPGNAVVNDLIVYAPDVIIESGFAGSIQVFASGSIQIRNNCSLEYPSFIALYADKSDKDAGINIGNNTYISGGILLTSSGVGKQETLLNLNTGTLIQGVVYSTAIQHKGTIKGTLCTEQIMLRTASSIYENHLLNCKIDRLNLNNQFAGPIIIDDMVNQKVIKWVN